MLYFLIRLWLIHQMTLQHIYYFVIVPIWSPPVEYFQYIITHKYTTAVNLPRKLQEGISKTQFVLWGQIQYQPLRKRAPRMQTRHHWCLRIYILMIWTRLAHQTNTAYSPRHLPRRMWMCGATPSPYLNLILSTM